MICPKCKKSPLELHLHKIRCTDYICDYEETAQQPTYQAERKQVWKMTQNGGKKTKKSTILG